MPWQAEEPGDICSLGPEILEWIMDHLCHGPGDLQGVRVYETGFDVEMIRFVNEMYRLDPDTGRRVYTQAVLSRQKGRAKSELAGFLAVAEAVGPVRFDHWDPKTHQPVGRPVVGPLIKCLATEESQAGNTFEVVSYIMSDWGPDHEPELFTGITGARTYQSATALYLPKGGEIRMCSSGAASKDGGKETFVVADETHLYVSTELKNMYATIARNLGSKRMLSEPHLLQTSTAPRQGEQSVYEQTLALWKKGELPDTTLFDHKEAKGAIRIRDKEHTMGQLYELWGEAAAWQDMERKYADMLDPLVCRDEADAARYYLNRMIPGSDAWIPKDVHERQEKKSVVVLNEPICLGFDGSLNDDSTVLRGCRMSDGYLFKLGTWAKPEGAAGVGWEVPRGEVMDAIREAFSMYQVVRLYADPHEWHSELRELAEEFDERDHRKGKVVNGRVIEWPTSRDVAMSNALNRLHTDLVTGTVWHDDDPIAAEHYGNAKVRRRGKMVLVKKEYPNSPRKIDSVVGDALAYEARADAIADGWDVPKGGLTRVKGRVCAY